MTEGQGVPLSVYCDRRLLAPRRKHCCRDCGRHRYEVGHVSARGLCVPCASLRVAESIDVSKSKTGAAYERYLARLAEHVDREQARLAALEGGQRVEQGVSD